MASVIIILAILCYWKPITITALALAVLYGFIFQG